MQAAESSLESSENRVCFGLKAYQRCLSDLASWPGNSVRDLSP